MLVLSRRVDEKIRIGKNITITVIQISPSQVRLGIEAPDDINIARYERFEEMLPEDPVSVTET